MIHVYLSVIVWESVPGAKSCGQPIWLKLSTEVGCDEIFQKPLWLTPLTFSFAITGGGGGGVIFCPLSTKSPAFQGAVIGTPDENLALAFDLLLHFFSSVLVRNSAISSSDSHVQQWKNSLEGRAWKRGWSMFSCPISSLVSRAIKL